MGHGNQRPEIELVRTLCLFWLPATLMMIQSKMNELAWRHHFPIISQWKIFLDLKGSYLHSQMFDLAEIRTCQRFYACPHYLQGSKSAEKRWRHYFPHFKSMGAFCCHGNQSFDPICPKTLCSLSPTPMMLQIKFDQDWPTGFRDIQVQKCEIFVTQGQVTPKWVIWFGLKSNSTELLCLSW